MDKLRKLDTANKKRDELGLEAFSGDSLKWFRAYITKNFSRFNAHNALAAGNYVKVPKPGFMYLYAYDPKTKDTLPYYDKFPLILCFNITAKGWYGINLHYLAPKIRQSIFEELLKTLNNTKFNDNTKFKLSWAQLSSLSKHRYIKHACKQYLFSQLVTPICKVDPKYWEAVTFLPIAQFEKASPQSVWKDV